jgi:hypothetical protein
MLDCRYNNYFHVTTRCTCNFIVLQIIYIYFTTYFIFRFFHNTNHANFRKHLLCKPCKFRTKATNNQPGETNGFIISTISSLDFHFLTYCYFFLDGMYCRKDKFMVWMSSTGFLESRFSKIDEGRYAHSCLSSLS